MTRVQKTLLVGALTIAAWALVLLAGYELRGVIWWVFGHGGPPA